MLEDPQLIKQGNNYVASFGRDSELVVRFDYLPIRDEEKSLDLGYEVMREVEGVWIMKPGSKDQVIRMVNYRASGGNPPDTERWPNQYAAFKNQQKHVHDGKPLEDWAPISRAMAMNLKTLNIYTVEQLSTVPDGALSNIMGGYDLRDKAKAWLQDANNHAGAMKLQEQNKDLQDQLTALKNQMEALSAPRRGRPPVNGNNDAENAA